MRTVIPSSGASGSVIAHAASPASRSCPTPHNLPDEPLNDAANRAAAEKQAGRVSKEQSYFPVVWRGAGPISAPKWTTETATLTDEETQDWVATVFVQAGAEPRPRGDEEAWKDFVDLLEGLRAVVAREAA